MIDDANPDLFNVEQVNKVSSATYLLTGVRQLIRILDIGLIVPELVACMDDAVAALSGNQLSGLSTIKGYPPVPVLLELKPESVTSQGIFPASSIKAVHFATKDELEEYQARGFENVPNDLFGFEVTPELFETSEDNEVNAVLAKIDRDVLRQNYRQYDVLAGLLWDCIVHAEQSGQVISLFYQISSHSRSDDITGALGSWIKFLTDAGSLTVDDTDLLAVYMTLLGERDVAEGWSSEEVLEEFARKLPPEIAKGDKFQGWYGYSKAVVNNEKELTALTDEGDVMLRAILLHLLNPNREEIERMAMREDSPGPKVLAMARTLAATRLGFAPLDAAGKLERPGAYYLVSDLLAAYINRNNFDLKGLQSESAETSGALLTWHGQTVNSYIAPTPPAETADKVKEGVKEEAAPYLALTDLQEMVLSLEIVESAEIQEGALTLELTKVVTKPLPKQASFKLQISDDHVAVLDSRLLDLGLKSHIAKLTGKRTMAALAYQTDQGTDFRFQMKEGEYFSAQIQLTNCPDVQELQSTLQRLLDCHAWMKSKI